MEPEQRYFSDLTDRQWLRVRDLIPEPKKGGRPAKYSRRAVANAVLFVQRTRCSWRSLPVDLPPWRSAFWYYSNWKKSGVLDRLLAEIRADECGAISSEATADPGRDSRS